MMCDRVIVGLVLFQLTLAGQLALRNAFKRAVLMAPLAIGTLWFAYKYSRTYRPLMKFIALRSLKRAEHSDLGRGVQEEAAEEGHQTVDEAREKEMRFEHPSLIMDLDEVWIVDKGARSQNGAAAYRD